MAPISTDLVGWAMSETPEAAFLSIIIVFIISIALLVICTTCKKHSFQLEEKTPKEKSSKLVKVEAKGDVARQNPAINEITSDEIGNVEIGKDALAFKPYRSHTLIPGARLHGETNGNAEVSVQH
ncbi:uncharacterized protein si:ch73-204p21.2 [Triplophysa dalaica]|uniref:uncharacterized protein si:ch73-204p21.2 n=1 Tax=Triplophysa dalaica TaxID=1582913 RepID=UPI0024DFC046|nr:uncharacterized protein si:ch73-204p21.2 [Triplophysa dalaica]